MVFEVRDLWPEVPVALGVIRGAVPKWATGALERFAYSHSARVVALSPAMKEDVVRTGFPSERVHVIPNISDLDLFRVPEGAGRAFRAKHPWLGQRPLVLYAGTLGLVNGVGYLVDVARALRAPGSSAQILVVGDGREERAVRQRANAAGVLNVTFRMMPGVQKRDTSTALRGYCGYLHLYRCAGILERQRQQGVRRLRGRETGRDQPRGMAGGPLAGVGRWHRAPCPRCRKGSRDASRFPV